MMEGGDTRATPSPVKYSYGRESNIRMSQSNISKASQMSYLQGSGGAVRSHGLDWLRLLSRNGRAEGVQVLLSIHRCRRRRCGTVTAIAIATVIVDVALAVDRTVLTGVVVAVDVGDIDVVRGGGMGIDRLLLLGGQRIGGRMLVGTSNPTPTATTTSYPSKSFRQCNCKRHSCEHVVTCIGRDLVLGMVRFPPPRRYHRG